MFRSNTQKLVVIAFLIAIEVILTRFCSIQTDIIRIGFGFLPIAVAGIMFGPLWAGAAYAAGDILGMLIFPSGAYFPGFTLTAFLTGCIYGFFLHKKMPSFKTIVVPVLIVCMGLNLFLDTLWLNILYGQGYLLILPARIVKCVFMIPIQILLIKIVWQKCLTVLYETSANR